MCLRNPAALLGALLACAATAAAQPPPELGQILSRLDRLEKENQALRQEVDALRAEMAGLRRPAPDGVQSAAPSVEDRLAIEEARSREQEQVKVGTWQRFPLRITGMALFNLFGNGSLAGGASQPVLASAFPGDRTWGGTLRQSILGLDFDGPLALWGGKVRGSVAVDFFGGSGQTLDSVVRLRTGSIEVNWRNRSLMVGQEKPLFAPRNPTSYAQVGVPALTAAGNLWRWQPQVRFEQRLGLGAASGLRAQVGFIQTSEDLYSADPADYTAPTGPYSDGALLDEHRRPGAEGRLEFWHRFDDTRRVEFAPAFHVSKSQIAGTGVPSNLFSLDWFFNPWGRLEFTGAFFRGQNIGHFGAPHPGFTLMRGGRVIPVHSDGGWGQFALRATDRLSFHFYGGEHDDRDRDLVYGNVGLNRAGGANFVYRLAPNVLLSFEASQMRTTYLGVGRRINNHYDLAVAYLF